MTQKDFIMKLRVSDIMDETFICLNINEKISELLNFIPNKGYTHVLILNDDGTAAGIISQNDIIEYFMGLLKTENDKSARDMELEKTVVGAIMTDLPNILYQDDSLGKASKLFDQYGIQALPVIDKAKKVVGMITFNSLLQELKKISKSLKMKSGFNFNNHRISSGWISRIHD